MPFELSDLVVATNADVPSLPYLLTTCPKAVLLEDVGRKKHLQFIEIAQARYLVVDGGGRRFVLFASDPNTGEIVRFRISASMYFPGMLESQRGNEEWKPMLPRQVLLVPKATVFCHRDLRPAPVHS